MELALHCAGHFEIFPYCAEGFSTSAASNNPTIPGVNGNGNESDDLPPSATSSDPYTVAQAVQSSAAAGDIMGLAKALATSFAAGGATSIAARQALDQAITMNGCTSFISTACK